MTVPNILNHTGTNTFSGRTNMEITRFERYKHIMEQHLLAYELGTKNYETGTNFYRTRSMCLVTETNKLRDVCETLLM